MEGEVAELERLRGEVRAITIQIIGLVAKRVELVRQIGEVKKRVGASIEDSKVTEELKRAVAEESKRLGLDEKFALDLLDLLVRDAIKVQEEVFLQDSAGKRE